mgnify:CR=1 FL=1
MHQGREGRSWPVYFGRETSAFSRSLSALSLLPQRRSINHVRRQSRQPQEQQRLLGRSAAREQLEQLPAQHSTPSLRRLNTIRVRGNGLLACYRDHEATAALRVPVFRPHLCASRVREEVFGGVKQVRLGRSRSASILLLERVERAEVDQDVTAGGCVLVLRPAFRKKAVEQVESEITPFELESRSYVRKKVTLLLSGESEEVGLS